MAERERFYLMGGPRGMVMLDPMHLGFVHGSALLVMPPSIVFAGMVFKQDPEVPTMYWYQRREHA